MNVNIIVAMDMNLAIGKGGKLPWAGKLPADMERFKHLTMGHPVIMGRKTWQSLPDKYRPLLGRRNIVVTRHIGSFNTGGAEICGSLEEALNLVIEQAEVFIIGGGEIYKQALQYADRLYVTWLDTNVDGDIFFPPIFTLNSPWVKVFSEHHTADAKNLYDYNFWTLEKWPVVNPSNGRTEEYRKELIAIADSGRCPFCPGGHTLTDSVQQKDFVHENGSWLVKFNNHPLSGADQHFTLILKNHKWRANELTANETAELFRAVDWIIQRYSVRGGALFMREGDSTLTGATVGHLHAQYVVPKAGEAVTPRFGPPPA